MNDYDIYKQTQQSYDSCEEFHTYVNKCCNTYGYSIEFAFSVKTIQEVGQYYIAKGICDVVNARTDENGVTKLSDDIYMKFEEDKSC